MMEKPQILTKSDYQKLKAELDYLINVERKKASERVDFARICSDADLLDYNAEYDEARYEYAKVEAKIAKLQEILANTPIKDIYIKNKEYKEN